MSPCEYVLGVFPVCPCVSSIIFVCFCVNVPMSFPCVFISVPPCFPVSVLEHVSMSVYL